MNTALTIEKPSSIYRILRKWISVEPFELAGLLSAFGCALTMFASYSLLRPIRETMGINSGVSSLPMLFWGTFFCMLIMQPIYGWLVSRYPRSIALPRVYLFFAMTLFAFYAWFLLQDDHTWIARAYFIWVSVFNLFVVAVFWSLMADVFNSEQASRFFGLIAGGFSLGGLIGPLLATSLAKPLGTINLLLVAASLLTVSALLMHRVTAWARVHSLTESKTPSTDNTALHGSAWDAFAQVAKSRYLLAVAIFVVLLTSVSTLVYLEQQREVSIAITDRDARTAFFGQVDFWVQSISLLVQLFIFGHLFLRLGISVLLLAVPLLMLVGFTLMNFSSSLSLIVGIMMVRRIGEYSITRPCRDMLMTVVSREEKYKAKNLIDTFIYRGGDALSASAFTALLAWSSVDSHQLTFVSGVIICALWMIVAWWLSKRFLQLERAQK